MAKLNGLRRGLPIRTHIIRCIMSRDEVSISDLRKYITHYGFSPNSLGPTLTKMVKEKYMRRVDDQYVLTGKAKAQDVLKKCRDDRFD